MANDVSRSKLKAAFKRNAIPTQDDFHDFIESSLNQADDGIAVDIDKVNIDSKKELHVKGKAQIDSDLTVVGNLSGVSADQISSSTIADANDVEAALLALNNKIDTTGDTVLDATADNIPNKIVTRDGSGDFAAGQVTLDTKLVTNEIEAKEAGITLNSELKVNAISAKGESDDLSIKNGQSEPKGLTIDKVSGDITVDSGLTVIGSITSDALKGTNGDGKGISIDKDGNVKVEGELTVEGKLTVDGDIFVTDSNISSLDDNVNEVLITLLQRIEALEGSTKLAGSSGTKLDQSASTTVPKPVPAPESTTT